MDEKNEELIEICADGDFSVKFFEDDFDDFDEKFKSLTEKTGSNSDGSNSDGRNPDGSNSGDSDSASSNSDVSNSVSSNPGDSNSDANISADSNSDGGNPDGGNPDGSVTPSESVVNASGKESAEHDDFAADIEAFEHDETDDEIIKNLSDSINMQVELELMTLGVVDENGVQNKSVKNGGEASETPEETDDSEEDTDAKDSESGNKSVFKKISEVLKHRKKWFIIPAALILVMVVVLIIYAVGHKEDILLDLGSEYIADRVTYQEPEPVPKITVTDLLKIGSAEGNIVEYSIGSLSDSENEPTDTPEPTPEVPEMKEVVNILLLGEENIESYGGRGRTDLINLVTINSRDRTISVTSFLRDSLVAIPGYSSNRINAVYAIGGVSLVYQCMEQNFSFVPDNYILVNFNGFEKAVDYIGGLDIELSAEEAAYLNKTNYIADPSKRNVKEGMNHMDGGQVLGYCRIRNVGTKNREYSDFGRSSRHREVLTKIFDRLSGMSLGDLLDFGDNCLPMITTDLDKETIEQYARMVLDIGTDTLKQYRVPIDGTYRTQVLRDMQVTEFDIERNVEYIKNIVE